MRIEITKPEELSPHAYGCSVRTNLTTYYVEVGEGYIVLYAPGLREEFDTEDLPEDAEDYARIAYVIAQLEASTYGT